MSAVFHHVIRRLREALSELYEAGCLAEAWLEEGTDFRPDAGLIPVSVQRPASGRARRLAGRRSAPLASSAGR